MIGAIVGDFVGSRFERSIWSGDRLDTASCIGFEAAEPIPESVGEHANCFQLDHPRCFFTDDTYLTFAVIDWMVSGGELTDYLRSHYRQAASPHHFGKFFRRWAEDETQPFCGSVGNGAAMRVSPVAWSASGLEEVRKLARSSALVTHHTKDAITGAEAIASACFLARSGSSKCGIRNYVSTQFEYELNVDLDAIRAGNRFTSDCPRTIPLAIAAFLDSESFEETLRRAISIGGDVDTIASMAGAVAWNYWGDDSCLASGVLAKLDSRQSHLLDRFLEKFAC